MLGYGACYITKCVFEAKWAAIDQWGAGTVFCHFRDIALTTTLRILMSQFFSGAGDFICGCI
jgi:hypothetical protein